MFNEDNENISGEDIKEQTNNDDSIMNEDITNALDEIKVLKEELAKKEKEVKEYMELAQRARAEFENYRKRASKEREQLYADITGDLIVKILPVIDNLERAMQSSSEGIDAKSLLEGITMIMNQFKDILSKEGLEEVEALNQQFDPNIHNAVMHVEDENFGDNTVVEVFQKGYKIKDKVLRHSMVKVAN
ncbi:protein GrpE [Oxobacter pfennigii]|uniref:Protein GrpE n=1 Tax=Oxobacter pfennigii TaxID=36849 RepID=A0A0P8W7W3_9CLOT|nr:nucleotide exchange factor GrpE [Oxobacter pfennigii]KPU44126.1 protein GrpE [Oxobacter pfennigii]